MMNTRISQGAKIWKKTNKNNLGKTAVFDMFQGLKSIFFIFSLSSKKG